MKDSRSASQILYGFLPEQTVDVKGSVWKVDNWHDPKFEKDVDLDTLRKELIRLATPWAVEGTDGGFVSNLENGRQIEVLSLDRKHGVALVPFPEAWICKHCKRVYTKFGSKCSCGYTGKKGQLPFVGYHDKCGKIRTPFIPKCKVHNDVRIIFPGTSTASEIKFECPTCNTLVRQGFGFISCDECGGKEKLSFNVHRSSSVYTPRSIVIVNPPSAENIKKLSKNTDARTSALSWVVKGMVETDPNKTKLTSEVLRQNLLETGLSQEVIDRMLKTALDSGELKAENNIEILKNKREEAENQAIIIALAASNSRVQVKDMREGRDLSPERHLLYSKQYPNALKKAGLNSVELIEKFPILSGHFGYTRGNYSDTKNRLKAFRNISGTYQVYAELAETEAFFVKLSAIKVTDWLITKGYSLKKYDDEISSRIQLLNLINLPEFGQDIDSPTLGSELLTLIHSYAHRFIRVAAVWAGLDRNTLSELLVPLHLGFYIYAVARGDFVMGGLQAVFETELNRLLEAFVYEESRCPLDPGCSSKGGGACVACLHLGEPSCRLFNRLLSRQVLFGNKGFLEFHT